MKQRDRTIETSSKIRRPKYDKQLKTLQTEVSEIKTAISEKKLHWTKTDLPRIYHEALVRNLADV